jgi:hypothetical protein
MVPMAALDERQFRRSQTAAATKPYHYPAYADVFVKAKRSEAGPSAESRIRNAAGPLHPP